jgi:uncharacterized protein (TIGR03083 family)
VTDGDEEGFVEHAPQPDHIRFLFDPRATLDTFAGQRRRLAASVRGLSADELATPSRCAGWSVADVLRHLVWADDAVRRIWSGDRSIAAGFDPRTTPDDAVRADRAVSDEEIRGRYLSSTERMVSDLVSSGPERFGHPSLSPAGVVPWWLSAVHIGWDSSIHERDALLPLGYDVEVPDDETTLSLAYSLVLASFFAGQDPLSVRIGTLELRHEPGPVVAQVAAVRDGDQDSSPGPPVAVEAKDPVVAIDAISGRESVEEALAGDAVVVHRLGGLARYFTSVPGYG